MGFSEFPKKANRPLLLATVARKSMLIRDNRSKGVIDVSREDQRSEPEQLAAEGAGIWAAVSHEIRTPLMGVVGMLEILSRTSLTEEQRRIIATAEHSSVALMRVVDDVLDFAKLESMSVTLEPTATDIGILLEECADVLAGAAASKGLALTCEFDPALPLVMCDPLRLRQLVTNLGGNAIKFTERGSVALSARLIDRGATAAVRLSVSDSGIGVPEELRHFLFRPFSQLAPGAGRGGAGLGLAICRRIVEIMGGNISFETAPGQGTTFNIDLTLPVAAEAPPSHRRLDGVTVVGIEGEPVLLIALRYLEAAGARIVRLEHLSDLAAHFAATKPSTRTLVVVGPDADPADVTAVWDALHRLSDVPPLLWLRPPGAAASPEVSRSTEIVVAYPMRRNALLTAATRACSGGDGAGSDALIITRRTSDAVIPVIGGDEAVAAARADGRVILLAEDNPVNQEVLRQQLAILGFDCDVAENGTAALRALAERKYLLLLCDCHMPGIDGFELTRMIRANEQPPARLPIIAVTANAMAGEAARCRAAGMDDYLAKPIEIRTLQTTLQRWLDSDHMRPIVLPSAEPARMPVRRAIDIGNLAAVYGAGSERLAIVLNQWRSGLSDGLMAITEALERSNLAAIADAAHRIKGSAGIAGAYAVSTEAARLETAARARDTATVRESAERLQDIAGAALAEVAEALTARKSGQAAVSATARGSAGTT
jgi:CheY-like chemotaxis protein/nitrogen-specific signal transduction histidine kinase/HPt (histidine-containing phosphotransfer) domain-containing protein